MKAEQMMKDQIRANVNKGDTGDQMSRTGEPK